MKRTHMLYWILNGLFAFVMLGSAIPDILMQQMAIDGFAGLHLPAYLLPFVGTAKLLGVVAILVPGYPRLKEWAYAGLLFDVLGATYCLACSNASQVEKWLPMFAFIALGALVYVWYHKRLKALAQAASVSNTGAGAGKAVHSTHPHSTSTPSISL